MVMIELMGLRGNMLFLFIILFLFSHLACGWISEPQDWQKSNSIRTRKSGISLMTDESGDNTSTINVIYPNAYVYITGGGTYQQFGNTSLDYIFHINASTPVIIEGFRNSSIYYITTRRNTELRISNFNTWIDRFNLTTNPYIDSYNDIDINTTTKVVFINKIVSIATTSSTITLPRNQVIFLTKMEPKYQPIAHWNILITEVIVTHETKPPLSKPMIAVVIICGTAFLMIVYYLYNSRQVLMKKVKALVFYEDLLLFEIGGETEVQLPDVEMPVLDDDKIDKKVVKYLKKAAKVAETAQQANGNVVAIFADRNGEIVDVARNQQAFISYQMTKTGRNTIAIQKSEEATNELQQLIQENASNRATEEALLSSQQSSKSGRKGRAGVKVIKAENVPIPIVPEVREDSLQDIEDDFAAPVDTSPQMTRTRGNAMVKLNQVSPAETTTNTPTVTNRKGGSSSYDDGSFSSKNNSWNASTAAAVNNNGTYVNSTVNAAKSKKVSPTATSSKKEVLADVIKPSEILAKSTSPMKSVEAAMTLSSDMAPLTNGLYYFPPTSSFAGMESSLGRTSITTSGYAPLGTSDFNTYATGGGYTPTLLNSNTLVDGGMNYMSTDPVALNTDYSTTGSNVNADTMSAFLNNTNNFNAASLPLNSTSFEVENSYGLSGVDSTYYDPYSTMNGMSQNADGTYGNLLTSFADFNTNMDPAFSSYSAYNSTSLNTNNVDNSSFNYSAPTLTEYTTATSDPYNNPYGNVNSYDTQQMLPQYSNNDDSTSGYGQQQYYTV